MYKFPNKCYFCRKLESPFLQSYLRFGSHLLKLYNYLFKLLQIFIKFLQRYRYLFQLWWLIEKLFCKEFFFFSSLMLTYCRYFHNGQCGGCRSGMVYRGMGPMRKIYHWLTFMSFVILQIYNVIFLQPNLANNFHLQKKNYLFV